MRDVNAGVFCYDKNFIQDPEVPPNVKMLLILLSTLDSSRHHSVNKLSLMLGCGDSRVSTMHRKAVELGYISYRPDRNIKSNPIKTGRRCFRFNLKDEFVRCG